MSVIGSFGIIESEKIDLIVQGSLEIHALMVSDFSRTESIFEPIVPLIAYIRMCPIPFINGSFI